MMRKALLAGGLFLLLLLVVGYSLPINYAGFFEKIPRLKVPISLETKGFVLEVLFDPQKVTKRTIRYTFSLNFTPIDDNNSEVRALAKLLGFGDPQQGYTKSSDGQWIAHRVGIRMPLRLSIKKANSSGILEDYYDKSFDQMVPYASGARSLDVSIDNVVLPPSEYLIRLELIDSVPQLAKYPVVLEVGTHAK